jgi:hypothetical protein
MSVGRKNEWNSYKDGSSLVWKWGIVHRIVQGGPWTINFKKSPIFSSSKFYIIEIWINKNIMDMKRQMLICLFIPILVGSEKEHKVVIRIKGNY